MKTIKLSVGRIFWMVACLALILSLSLSMPSYAKTTQEINREVNTISAKANDAVISQRTVEIKSELEKIREQVQNIE